MRSRSLGCCLLKSAANSSSTTFFYHSDCLSFLNAWEAFRGGLLYLSSRWLVFRWRGSCSRSWFGFLFLRFRLLPFVDHVSFLCMPLSEAFAVVLVEALKDSKHVTFTTFRIKLHCRFGIELLIFEVLSKDRTPPRGSRRTDIKYSSVSSPEENTLEIVLEAVESPLSSLFQDQHVKLM